MLKITYRPVWIGTVRLRNNMESHYHGKSWTRFPFRLILRPNVLCMLKSYFRTEEPLVILGVDFRTVDPVYLRRVKESHDGIEYDAWGTGYRCIKNSVAGIYHEAAIMPLAQLKTLDDVESYPWPDPDAFDYSSIENQCRQHKGICSMCRKRGIS